MKSCVYRCISGLIYFLIIFVFACGGGDDDGLLLDPNFNISNASGSYSGTYTGDLNGNWSLYLYPDGRVSGYADGVYISGKVDGQGRFSASSDDGINITGVINGENVSGTWSGDDMSGTLSGSKYADRESEYENDNSSDSSSSSSESDINTNSPGPIDRLVSRFVGTYEGTYVVGDQIDDWSFTINESGEINGTIRGEEANGEVDALGSFSINYGRVIMLGSLIEIGDEILIDETLLENENTFYFSGRRISISIDLSQNEECELKVYYI